MGSPTQVVTEGGGFVVSCACKWLRFFASMADARNGRREHEKKCKVARGEGE